MKRFLRPLYHKLRKFLDTTLLGTKFQEWLWKKEEFSDSKSYESMFAEAIVHPHRKFIIDHILEKGPIESALELGCHQGYNLAVLHERNPGITLHGIDINARAIKEGTERLSAMGISTDLKVEACDQLSGFKDNSMDIVFADAIIIYIGPDKIRQACKEWIRVATKSIFLYEWNWSANSKDNLSLYETGHWVHDYTQLFNSLPEVDTVTIHKIPDDANYQDALWKKYGALVEVQIKSR